MVRAVVHAGAALFAAACAGSLRMMGMRVLRKLLRRIDAIADLLARRPGASPSRQGKVNTNRQATYLRNDSLIEA